MHQSGNCSPSPSTEREAEDWSVIDESKNWVEPCWPLSWVVNTEETVFGDGWFRV